MSSEQILSPSFTRPRMARVSSLSSRIASPPRPDPSMTPRESVSRARPISPNNLLSQEPSFSPVPRMASQGAPFVRQSVSDSGSQGGELAKVLGRFLTVSNVRGVLTGDFSEYRPLQAPKSRVSPRKDAPVASVPPISKTVSHVSPRLAKKVNEVPSSSESDVELPLRRSTRVQRIIPPSQRNKGKKKRAPSPRPARKSKKPKLSGKSRAVPKSAR